LKPSILSLTGIVLSLTILIGAGCNSIDHQTAPANTANTANMAKPTIEVTASPTPAAAGSIDHIVIVVEENHSYKQIMDSPDAAYTHALIERGALFTDAHGVTHPSQGNYIALFSGSTQGIKDDSCQKPFTSDNLASQLLKANLTFVGYSEDLPRVGYTGCSSKGYARKHNPWCSSRMCRRI
jgi:phosphatidylinositol-3-phosphatase